MSFAFKGSYIDNEKVDLKFIAFFSTIELFKKACVTLINHRYKGTVVSLTTKLEDPLPYITMKMGLV